MATKIDIRDQIQDDWENRGLDLSFLPGLKVRHQFYEMGVVVDYCHNCGRIRIEFDSEDLSINIGVFMFFWEGSDFSLDLKALRKMYIKNKERLTQKSERIARAGRRQSICCDG